MNQLTLKKPLEMLLDELKSEQRLRRVLGPIQLSALGVGAIIGTGIFVLVGVAAHDRTGPALMLSFVAAGRDLRVRRALLCRVRVDGAGGRLGLHLRVRHARRAAWRGSSAGT